MTDEPLEWGYIGRFTSDGVEYEVGSGMTEDQARAFVERQNEAEDENYPANAEGKRPGLHVQYKLRHRTAAPPPWVEID